MRYRLGVLLIASLLAAGAMGDDRMKDVAAMLPARPVGLGRPISDRTAWSKLAKVHSFKRIVQRAEELAATPIPEQPDDLFLDFSRTGNRTRWEAVARSRRARLRVFTLAECVENKGRFIKPLEEALDALCAERTWVMPAHDRPLTNFHGETHNIDLASAALAWEASTSDYLLGDCIAPRTRRRLRAYVRKHVLNPFTAMISGELEKNWWMLKTNNWNAVCLAGVTGAALALEPSREKRARFILAAEKYSHNFLSGFGKDGYCTEGLSYWNYGFGHYVMLTETVLQATGGKVDLLAKDAARQPALFGARVEIINGLSPAFADCPVNAKPNAWLMAYLNRRFDLGLSRFKSRGPAAGGQLFECLLYSFPNSMTDRKVKPGKATGPGLRTWFDTSGILISRPQTDSACRMGVAMKGGHNNEHHNHNDVGSFIVVQGKTPVLLDPGAEVYTSRTFSGQRYESKVLNSYGHPVPVVAGKLQSRGEKARGKALATKFTDTTDTLVLDLKSAYAVGDLKKLTRTFVYSRTGAGSLTITDEVEFKRSRDFSAALVILGTWKKLSADRLRITDGDEAVVVKIEVSGAGFDIKAETLDEDVRTKRQPTRLGINLTKPVTKAKVVMTLTPARARK